MTRPLSLSFSITYLLSFVCVAYPQQKPTWDIIQERVLNQNCIQCHLEGTSFARQSGLVLTADVAYDNLVDVIPKNSAAASDGLVRVSSRGRFAHSESFLWEKINVANQDHFYQDHPNYGAMMPLGLPSLTNGELAYIKQWIETGASRNEVVADEALLEDSTRYEPPEFVALDPPEQGIQFHLGPFEVWPAEKHDREFLYYQPYPTEEDMYVTRYEISYRANSHHFILFNYPKGNSTPPANTFRDMRTQNGTPNFANLLQLGQLFPFYFFVGTQIPYTNYHFPAGVALRLPAGSGFDLNSHHVNRTSEAQVGEVYVNLHTIDRSEVQFVADYDNFGNYDINLPPNKVTTLAKAFFFKETRQLIYMWSHSHEHTLEFQIEGVGGTHDGELLYWTNDWEHPPFLELDPPLTFEAGDGVILRATYDNWTNEPIGYGPLSSDEMMFMFYIYYTGGITAVEEGHPVPETFVLKQNYPNPFNPETTIEYVVPASGHVTLKIYNVLGSTIRTLVDEQRPAGQHRVVLNGGDLPSGIYYYRLEAGGTTEIKKMILIK